ncbi:NADPH-dependent stearoyl-CoA 9-desaturase [Bathymodiolus japonicus methanotrophic gill symbiont]|uniref:fatty acid desaturase family protein n=1 Tax=Bathymodiolus japonicus methanotrophic gill symbiont TaxID=113269 RepID=UPI001B41CFB9|nr:fatty acid desaturase [Bathymodiolus japonicus methanotrophic gill symbiont]GFO72485.1 NADPH-dependent stearoyl-CoA 9-desaturase [Bathymodiolus japonicus methanotrophic gill symbiont]
MSLKSYQNVDREALAKDLDEIHKEVLARVCEQDFKHLKKMERWGQLCSLLGYGTAWIFPNPISALLISQGSFTRWTQMTHPIVHKGYDKIANIPASYTSTKFAQGWRRFIDWPDWITPAGWHQEHDILHHYNLGEKRDPDHLQHNMQWLRQSNTPMGLRYAIVALFTTSWKILYYTPRTHKELRISQARKKREVLPAMTRIQAWSPFSQQGRALWLESILPYIGFRFILLPLLFLPLGTFAASSVLLTSLLAEAFTNMHSFLVIVPNHAGDDVMMFEDKGKGRGEFFLRQILGSVNYPTGSDFNDFFYGWLNYQIEHHLWPDIPLNQYQYVQPKVVEVCKKHGIPYRQDSVFKRLRKAVDIMVGRTSMLIPMTHANG